MGFLIAASIAFVGLGIVGLVAASSWFAANRPEADELLEDRR